MTKHILIGTFGINPEPNDLEYGIKLAQLSLATSEKYNDEEHTEWHSLVFWGKTAEIVERWVRKGSKIAVEEKSKKRSYETKEGNKAYVVEVHVKELDILTWSEENKS